MNFPLILQSVSLQQKQIELFVPDAETVREAYERGDIPFPYWSQVWPAAKALAIFLLQHSHYTNAKRILEAGAGLGLPSLVAAANAEQVLCTDKAPEAVEIMKLSVAHLELHNVTFDVLDWCYLPQNVEADVLLLSDINYERDAFHPMQTMITSFLQKGTTILLSTPQRLVAKEFLAPLLADCTQQEEILVMHDGKRVAITVIVLERNKNLRRDSL